MVVYFFLELIGRRLFSSYFLFFLAKVIFIYLYFIFSLKNMHKFRSMRPMKKSVLAKRKQVDKD